MKALLNDLYKSAPTLEVQDFLTLSSKALVLDVRSESEYLHAHIPGAESLPLLNDLTRASVGRIYKESGRTAAIEHGFSLLSECLLDFQSAVHLLYQKKSLAPNQPLFLYCWRGGDRSRAMEILLESAGFVCHRLCGGYKSFRKYVLEQFSLPYSLCIVGGYTGTGKTDLLKALSTLGEQILDLEMLAQHRGSAFGQHFELEQGSTEDFENRLALQLARLEKDKIIWVEDESLKLGKLSIPHEFFLQMSAAPALWVERPLQDRLECILSEYKDLSDSALAMGIEKIKKRLGSLRSKRAHELLEQKEIRELALLLLEYYDKAYEKQRQKRNFVCKVLHTDVKETTSQIISCKQLLHNTNKR